MAEAVKGLLEVSQDPEFREMALARNKEIKNWNSNLYAAKMEGKGKGREEREEEIALNMLKNNFEQSVICEMTGLSEESVAELAKKADR